MSKASFYGIERKPRKIHEPRRRRSELDLRLHADRPEPGHAARRPLRRRPLVRFLPPDLK